MTGMIFFGLIALGILWAALRIVWPFSDAIIMAAIIVTLSFPMFRRVRAKLRCSSATAAVIMLIGITFLLIIPLFILALLLIDQAGTLFQHLQSGEAQRLVARMDLASRLSFIQKWVPSFDPQSLSPQHLFFPIARAIPGWVAANGRAVVGSVAGIIIEFFLVLLASFFFFVEGEAILDELGILSPLRAR